jgi:hypothetical protein
LSIVGQLRSRSFSPNASTAAQAASRREDERDGESRREDESVVPELDASRHCGGDPQSDLENELINAKAIYLPRGS